MAAFGHGPDSVIWQSPKNELSPYDIRSVDAQGKPFYIEMKTTTNSRVDTLFEISAPELVEASRRRDRNHIYRVLGAGTDR